MPKDVQNIFEEVNRDVALNLFNKFWWEGTIRAKKTYEESMGGKSYFLSPNDLAKMDKIWQEVNKKHVGRRMKIEASDVDKIEAEFKKLELKYGTPLIEAYSN